MSAQSQYREAFLTIRALLQKYDPHGLMAEFAGDRFDNEIYGYEATTLLERHKSGNSSEAVEESLNSLASKHRRQADVEAIKNAAAQIATVLGTL